MLRDAERGDPLNLWFKWQLGWYLGDFGGEWEESIGYLTAVIDATPDHMFALVTFTQTHLNAGQIDKAESPLSRLEKSKAPNAYQYAMFLRAELEVLRGDIGKAQTVYNEGRRVAESGTNKSPDLWLTLGIAATQLGHLDEAISLFNRSFDDGAVAIVLVRSFVTAWPSFTQGHGPALMAHSDFQAFLRRMNLDDVSMAALAAAETAR
jgi:tetratricopeptide (TPR) repeat protein